MCGYVLILGGIQGAPVCQTRAFSRVLWFWQGEDIVFSCGLGQNLGLGLSNIRVFSYVFDMLSEKPCVFSCFEPLGSQNELQMDPGGDSGTKVVPV